MSDNQCQICFEGNTHQETRKTEYSFKGYSITVDQPGLWCDTCDEAILSGADLQHNTEELENFQKEVKLKIARDVKEKRKKLQMSQKEASEIFGGGIRAFHKYEKGEILPSRSTINLLTILSNHPDLLKEIKP